MSLIPWQRSELTSWPSFSRLTSLRDELDRLFETPVTQWANASRFLSGAVPALDVHEDKDNYIVKAELPGMKKEDIDVSLQDGVLSISGERKSEESTENTTLYRSERFFGRFQRTVKLPASVSADKIKAQYKDGVLTVTLPKTEEAKPKQIDVQVN